MSHRINICGVKCPDVRAGEKSRHVSRSLPTYRRHLCVQAAAVRREDGALTDAAALFMQLWRARCKSCASVKNISRECPAGLVIPLAFREESSCKRTIRLFPKASCPIPRLQSWRMGQGFFHSFSFPKCPSRPSRVELQQTCGYSSKPYSYKGLNNVLIKVFYMMTNVVLQKHFVLTYFNIIFDRIIKSSRK